jgi:hypothetical protein
MDAENKWLVFNGIAILSGFVSVAILMFAFLWQPTPDQIKLAFAILVMIRFLILFTYLITWELKDTRLQAKKAEESLLDASPKTYGRCRICGGLLYHEGSILCCRHFGMMYKLLVCRNFIIMDGYYLCTSEKKRVPHLFNSPIMCLDECEFADPLGLDWKEDYDIYIDEKDFFGVKKYIEEQLTVDVESYLDEGRVMNG